jgi:argininosuccinate lyase
VTGQIVALAERKDLDLAELPLTDMQTIEPRITEAVFDVLTVDASVASRVSYGGTAPALVAQAAAKWLEALS